jgi:hypothetical protein
MEGKGKLIYTNWAGRTFVDPNLLLQDPKVKQTIRRLSELTNPLRGRPGIIFLKPPNSAE